MRRAGFPDFGEVREELEGEYNAEPIAIGFNPKYVVELLTQMTSDQITISLGARELGHSRREPAGCSARYAT